MAKGKTKNEGTVKKEETTSITTFTGEEIIDVYSSLTRLSVIKIMGLNPMTKLKIVKNLKALKEVHDDVLMEYKKEMIENEEGFQELSEKFKNVQSESQCNPENLNEFKEYSKKLFSLNEKWLSFLKDTKNKYPIAAQKFSATELNSDEITSHMIESISHFLNEFD